MIRAEKKRTTGTGSWISYSAAMTLERHTGVFIRTLQSLSVTAFGNNAASRSRIKNGIL